MKDNFIIVVPYVNEAEIAELKKALGWQVPIHFWKDESRIGSDLAYQTLWNLHKDLDIIILHADMMPMPEDTSNKWLDKLLEYVDKFPEAGMFGTTLMYPAKNPDTGNYYIQHAGGRFENGEAIHFGGGLDVPSRTALRGLEEDFTKYSGRVREVSWVTFGGVYIRRSLLDTCGNFDPSFYWTYYRDVDYCLTARSLGYKIYQTPVQLLHFEGRDNKLIQQQNPKKAEQAAINYKVFRDKWKDSELLTTLDRVVYDEKE